LVLLTAATVGCVVGCASPSHDHDPTTQPAVATDADPARAEPEFWLAQTPVQSVGDPDFDRLWAAAERVSQDYLFPIDRRDRRLGRLTTTPTISAQWFEPWRRELQTAGDVAESSVATVRRSIVWEFRPVSNGFAVTPKVLIERQAFAEQRVSGVLSRAYLRRAENDDVYGTRETDKNVRLPDSYWYPVGRDFAFEERLAAKMLQQLDRVRTLAKSE
jgi:hypothetical protein